MTMVSPNPTSYPEVAGMIVVKWLLTDAVEAPTWS